MTVVLDSNLAVALALDQRRAPAIEARLRSWEEAGESIHSPSLFEISLHGLIDGPAVIAVARRLQRKSAYDAAYVALAQELGAELWTLDGPLARNAAGVSLPVRLLDA